jgi:mannosyltransferase OCH1-like enzyme
VSPSPIPRIIWQTYRSRELPPEAEECRDSWRSLNPGWDYRFVDDNGMDDFARKTLPPPAYQLFRALPLGVMKADFWRYLVTHEHGGLYADLDTACLAPIDEWLPREAAFVVCPENRSHLCQWTFLAVPKHPCLEAALDLLIERVGKGVEPHRQHFVHHYTGPGLWTDAICSTLESRESDMITLSKKKDLLRAHELKVQFLDWKYFNGFKVRHLFGSRFWGKDYGRWLDEEADLRKGTGNSSLP